ncbi:MAG: hypothetical protein ACC608_00265 [Anaerofustis sp.]
MGKILYRAARNVPNATAAGGNSYRQAKAEGKSDEEASAYSLLNGAANLAFGTFFEGLGMKEGNTSGQNGAITKVKEGINRAVSKVIKNPNTVKTIAALSKNMGEAAAQTFLQEAIDPILRNATLGESNTLGDIWNHAMSKETMDMMLNSVVIASAMSLGGSGKKKNGSTDIAGEGGLLNEANLKRLSDADLKKVGDAVTNAYAETVKADPNLHVTDAQIEAYKKQSKKNMGSRENTISEILAKTDELKNSFSNQIEAAKGKAKEAGIEVDETASNKTLQGDGDGGRIQESGALSAGDVVSEKSPDGENADFLQPELLDELAQSGVKYNSADVVMVAKTEDGTLLWLENGTESSGLTHIVNTHGIDFSAKGVENIHEFLFTTLKQKPFARGTNERGHYAIYQIGNQKYLLAYGTNGYIVSFYPCK